MLLSYRALTFFADEEAVTVAARIPLGWRLNMLDAQNAAESFSGAGRQLPLRIH